MKTRKILIRAGVLLLCLALAAVMMLIGRGHTVYIDNKTLEYNGTEYKAFFHVDVSVKGESKLFKLDARDRVSAKCIGQSFHMELTITDQKGAQPRSLAVDLDLPYGVDNPIINLPALMAGLPKDAWMDEFIPAPPSEEPEDVNLGDELGGELGDELGVDPDAGILE